MRFSDQRGMILVISLLILALLIGAGVGAIVSMQIDFRTSANLKTGTQAFDLAEAGIEWAKQQVKKSAVNPPNPSGATKTMSTGTFTVTFSDAAKESKLVGKVTASSTGAVGNSSSTIVASIRKTYELSDGAIAMRGETEASFTGASLLVDGKDYNTDGTLVTGAKKHLGISVPDASHDTTVTSAVADNQLNRIQGKGTAPDIQPSDFLSSSEMTQLANDLCDPANAPANKSTYNVPASGTATASLMKRETSIMALTEATSGGRFVRLLHRLFSGVEALAAAAGGEGSSCTDRCLQVPTKTTWGGPASPKLVCINGTNAADDKVDFQGNFTGAGILVIKGSNVEINGAFHWEGLILISGANVSFKIAGGGNKDIFGSVMVNETGSDSGSAEVDLQGAVNVLYSTAALKNAMDGLYPSSSSIDPLREIYDNLPSTMSQVYWRTVSN